MIALYITKRKLAMIGNCKKKIIIITSAFVIALIGLFVCYNHDLDHKEIASGHLIPSNGEYVYYSIVKENDLEDIYNCSYDLPNYDFDFKNHSYIITFGYEIVELSYSLISQPIFHGFDYYVPRVQLLNKKDDLCRIYEIPKVNIDVDPDNYKRNVYFVKE